jgi:hypothetical protein
MTELFSTASYVSDYPVNTSGKKREGSYTDISLDADGYDPSWDNWQQEAQAEEEFIADDADLSWVDNPEVVPLPETATLPSFCDEIKPGDRVDGWHPFLQKWVNVEVTVVNRKSFQGIGANSEVFKGLTLWQNLSPKSISAQEPESGISLQDLSSDSSSSELQKLTPTAVTSSNSGTLESPITEMSGNSQAESAPTSSLLPLPASLSQSKGNEEVLTTPETVSPPSSERSPESSLNSSQLKTFPDSLAASPDLDQGNSTLNGFSGSFTYAGTMSNGSLSPAPTLERPGVETDCLLLESPTALSSVSEDSRPAGQTALENQCRQEGAIALTDVANPAFLENGSGVDTGFTDVQDKRSAWEFLQAMESSESADQSLETPLIQELQKLPSEGSSISTASLLEEFGFIPSVYSADEEREMGDHQKTYKGWDILFSVPNGGILACIICRWDEAYQFPVGDTDEDWEFHFDYLDSDGVLSHAKKAIDSLEVQCERGREGSEAAGTEADEVLGIAPGVFNLNGCPDSGDWEPTEADESKTQLGNQGIQFSEALENGRRGTETTAGEACDRQRDSVNTVNGIANQGGIESEGRSECDAGEAQFAESVVGWASPDRSGDESVHADTERADHSPEAVRENFSVEPGEVWVDPHLIIVDQGTQSRIETDLDTVKRYAEAMREGLWNWEQKPLPIAFLAPDGSIYASDCHHRTVAATLAGKDRVLFDLRTGTLEEAILFSCKANRNHGLTLRPRDQRKQIEMFLDTRDRLPEDDERKKWGGRLIAKYLNLPESGYRTVINIMKERRERAEKISRQQEKENSTGKISLSVEQEVEQQAGSLGLRGGSSQVLPDTQPAIAPWEIDDRPFAPPAPIPVVQPSELSLEEIWELALECLEAEEFDLDPSAVVRQLRRFLIQLMDCPKTGTGKLYSFTLLTPNLMRGLKTC